jgi:two-component system response regulator RegA
LAKPAEVEAILGAFEEGKRAAPDEAIPDQPLSVDRLTWEHIQRVLGEHDGNISATARALKMHRRTLQRKLMKRPAKT